jgi:hypothetical protein
MFAVPNKQSFNGTFPKEPNALKPGYLVKQKGALTEVACRDAWLVALFHNYVSCAGFI